MYLNFKQTILLILLFNLSYNIFGQSPYGHYSYYGREEGLHHTYIRSIYEDKKGFVWLCSSEGLMRWDGMSFELFGKSQTDSSQIIDSDITCIVQDENDYTFWIGTSISCITSFDVEKGHYKNYQPKDFPKDLFKRIEITAIQQIEPGKFIVGTKHQGLYFFTPYEEKKFSKMNFTFKESKIIHKIEKGEKYIWVGTNKGILKLTLKGEFVDRYSFTDKKDLNGQKCVFWKVKVLIEDGDDHFLFFVGKKIIRFNKKDGSIKLVAELPVKNIIKDIETDKDNNIWVSVVDNGIFFYDRLNKHLAKSNCHYKQVLDINFLKNQDIMLIGAKRGLSKYNSNFSNFKQYKISNLTNNISSSVFAICKDSRNELWFHTHSGFFHIKDINKKHSAEKIDLKTKVYQIVEDGWGNMWFITRNGLHKYDYKKKKYFHFPHIVDSNEGNKKNKITRALINDSKIWIGGSGNLLLFDIEKETSQVYPFPSNIIDIECELVNSLIMSKDSSSIWITTHSDKILKFDIKRKKFDIISLSKYQSFRDNPGYILNAIQDTIGRLWLPTFGAGLLAYNPNDSTLSYELAENELENNVYAIEEDNQNNIWVSTNFGLTKVNPYTKEVVNYTRADGVLCDEFNERSSYKNNDESILFGGIDWIVEFNPTEIKRNEYDAPVYVKAWTIEHNTLKHQKDFKEDINHIYDKQIVLDKPTGQIKFYTSVLDFAHPKYNKIKWKLKGYDKEWHIDYAKVPIIYPKLPPGKYTLLLKGLNADGHLSEQTDYVNITVKARFYETLYFKIALIAFIILIVFIIFKRVINSHQSKELKLAKAVDGKTKELVIANNKLARSFEQLEWSHEEILNQKTELEIHRNNLEEIVRARIMDLEVAKNKAERSDMLKSTFLANLSHEIRTPMNAIMGFSILLDALDHNETEQRKEAIASINTNGRKLLRIIHDIVDISKMESENLQINLKDICLNNMIKSVLSKYNSNNVEFRKNLEIDGEKSVFVSDGERLTQIIDNLLSNAFKFTDNGYVEITTKTIVVEDLVDFGFDIPSKVWGKDIFLCIVKDSGIGIPKDKQDNVFSSFIKVDYNHKIYEGMGLGLSIVKYLVNLLGGDVRLESETDKGSTFYFYVVSNPENCVRNI